MRIKKIKVIHLTKLSNHLTKNFDNYFAGKWCKPFDKDKKIIEHKKHDKNLRLIEDKTLDFLIKKLNLYHSVNYDKKFWKIVLLPWIKSFVYILYDRTKIIEKLIKKNEIKYFLIFNNYSKKIIPENYLEYSNKISDNIFNNSIFNEILKFKRCNKIKYFNIHDKKKNTNKNIIINKFNYKNLISSFSNKKILFYDSYLDLRNHYRLYLKYSFINSESNMINSKKVDFNFRNIDNNFISKNKNFQNFVNQLSISYIPKSYLENFELYSSDKIDNSKIIQAEKIITANSHITNDKFKILYAKSKIEFKKKKLISIQYGAESFFKNEEFVDLSKELSDNRLIWGNFRKNKKFRYIGINPNNKIQKKNKNKKILYICNEFPLFNYKKISCPTGPNFEKHILLHEKFFKSLSKKILQKIDIKPYAINYGWNIVRRLKKINPNFRIVEKNNIKDLCTYYDLIICALPSTSFLETIYHNVPTITLFSKKNWKFNSFVNKQFNDLSKLKIIFKNSDKASKHINTQMNEFIDNWHTHEYQKKISYFKKMFICENQDYYENINKILKNL